MRLQNIELTNFLCHRRLSLAVKPEAKALLVCGPNGAGKSAILDAIAYGLGDGMPRGVTRKADLSELLLHGEKDGKIQLDVSEDGKEKSFKLSLKNGIYGGDSPAPLTAAERSALVPRNFINADVTDRRRMLYALAGIKIGLDQVFKDLEGDGHDPIRIERIREGLRAGFGAAAKDAANLATEARGAWRSITGETYGDVKAADWKAAVPEAPERPSKEVRALLEPAKKALDSAKQILADLEATQRQSEGLAEARAKAAKVDALKDAVAAAEAKLKTLEGQEADAKASASGGGWAAPCPECGTVLESSKAGDLHRYDPATSGPEGLAKVKALSQQVADARAVLTKDRAALQHAEAFAAALANMPEPPDPAELEQAREDVKASQAEVVRLERELEIAVAAENRRHAASEDTARARQHHADVQAFSALSKAVEALPARYLDAALKKVNATLAELTPAFGGTPVVIGADLVPAYGVVSYQFLSRSEKWRVELAIGYALASRTHGLCIVDEFDLLHPAARGPVLKWMASQEAVQFIVAATLKEPPKLPPAIQVAWLGETTEK